MGHGAEIPVALVEEERGDERCVFCSLEGLRQESFWKT
jgi:hypothetical protein